MHTRVPHPLRDRAGVSLIEIVVVVFIVGLAAAMAVPRMRGVVKVRSVQSALNRVATDLAVTRIRAIRTGAPSRLAISADGTSYSVIVDPTAAKPDTFKTVSFATDYPGLVLSPASGAVTFNSRGMVSGGGTVVRATRMERSDSVTISGVGVIYRGY